MGNVHLFSSKRGDVVFSSATLTESFFPKVGAASAVVLNSTETSLLLEGSISKELELVR